MLKALLKTRLLSLWASISKGSKKKKNTSSSVLLIIVFAFVTLYMLTSMTLMFFGLGTVLKEQESGWAFFALVSLIASALCLFGSVFATKTQIFESGDNELLLSMPIPPKYILISRIMILLIINYLLEAIVMLPGLAVYGIIFGYTVEGFIYAVIGFVLLPLLSLAVSALIAWIISYIASKLRNKTLVTSVLFFAVFFVYMYACFSIGATDEANIDVAWLKNTFIFYNFGVSVANGGFLNFLIFASVAIASALITFAVISFSFIKIITTKKTAKKKEYVAKNEKSSSPFFAIVKKETKRFFSSTTYLMNSGIGVVMLFVCSILASVNASTILDAIEVQFSDPTQAVPKELIYGFIPVVIAIVANFISSMCMIATPSISLENKSLWILQSLPVSPRTVLFAKITNHILLAAPLSAISVIIACVSFKVSVINTALATLSCIGMIVFTAYFGMYLGVKFPKFDWLNENVAVKQGFAVFGSMFGSMLYASILSIGAFLLAIVSPMLSLVLMVSVSAILCVLLHLYFVYKAEKDFEKLKDK